MTYREQGKSETAFGLEAMADLLISLTWAKKVLLLLDRCSLVNSKSKRVRML